MSFKLSGVDYELRLTTLAVEKIEDKFDCGFSELFSENKVPRMGVLMYVFYVMCKPDMSLEDFKEAVAEEYSYTECVEIITGVFEGKNAKTDGINKI